jgi:hypothetical protein
MDVRRSYLSVDVRVAMRGVRTGPQQSRNNPAPITTGPQKLSSTTLTTPLYTSNSSERYKVIGTCFPTFRIFQIENTAPSQHDKANQQLTRLSTNLSASLNHPSNLHPYPGTGTAPLIPAFLRSAHSHTLPPPLLAQACKDLVRLSYAYV